MGLRQQAEQLRPSCCWKNLEIVASLSWAEVEEMGNSRFPFTPETAGFKT